jgi:hypothetical protein
MLTRLMEIRLPGTLFTYHTIAWLKGGMTSFRLSAHAGTGGAIRQLDTERVYCYNTHQVDRVCPYAMRRPVPFVTAYPTQHLSEKRRYILNNPIHFGP